MSYDLYFWREEENLKESADKICELLSDDSQVQGVATLARSVVRQRFRDIFPEIDDGNIDMDWEGAGSYFQISFNHADEKNVNCIIITCGYKLLDSPDTMNLIIDVGNSLGCALYDPQVGERFGQPESQQTS